MCAAKYLGIDGLKYLISGIRGRVFPSENYTYEGRDLVKAFNAEIASADGAETNAKMWNWIHGRLNAHNTSDIHYGDYLTLGDFSYGGKTESGMKIRVLGTNNYKGLYSQEHWGDYDCRPLAPVPDHIDFISENCLQTTFQWNTGAVNSGTGDGSTDDGTDQPWLQSDLYKKLNVGEDSVYAALPDYLKTHITPKMALMERRGRKSPALTASTGYHWYPIGHLWLPSEMEVFGETFHSDRRWANAGSVQYPLFAHSWRFRLKTLNDSAKTRCHWWLCVVSGYDAAPVCAANWGGIAACLAATVSLGVPLCFRICANQ